MFRFNDRRSIECRNWDGTQGSCFRGSSCRYIHVPKSGGGGGGGGGGRRGSNGIGKGVGSFDANQNWAPPAASVAARASAAAAAANAAANANAAATSAPTHAHARAHTYAAAAPAGSGGVGVGGGSGGSGSGALADDKLIVDREVQTSIDSLLALALARLSQSEAAPMMQCVDLVRTSIVTVQVSRHFLSVCCFT
jgi:hypothetical protein